MKFTIRDLCWLTLVVACLGCLVAGEWERSRLQGQINVIESARSKYHYTLYDVAREWAAETNREVRIEMPEGRPLYARPDGKLSHQSENLHTDSNKMRSSRP
jgi:hypothetical protein